MNSWPPPSLHICHSFLWVRKNDFDSTPSLLFARCHSFYRFFFWTWSLNTWDLSHSKRNIIRYILSTEPFLRNAWGLRYLKNKTELFASHQFSMYFFPLPYFDELNAVNYHVSQKITFIFSRANNEMSGYKEKVVTNFSLYYAS